MRLVRALRRWSARGRGPPFCYLLITIIKIMHLNNMNYIYFLELARSSLRLWEIRTAILEKQEDLEQLESLVRAARLPEDYALESLRRACMRVIST